MNRHHLAQINIAHAHETMDSKSMQGFVERLDEINQLADEAEGFIWRLQTEEGHATSIQAFDDPLLLVNMSVWKDIKSLKHYVYKTAHVELIQDRDAWFNKMLKMHQALWRIPEGHMPSVDEGKQKLEYLQKNEPSKTAFIFSRPFDSEK